MSESSDKELRKLKRKERRQKAKADYRRLKELEAENSQKSSSSPSPKPLPKVLGLPDLKSKVQNNSASNSPREVVVVFKEVKVKEKPEDCGNTVVLTPASDKISAKRQKVECILSPAPGKQAP